MRYWSSPALAVQAKIPGTKIEEDAIAGIIQVPLLAFIFKLSFTRGKDPKAAQKLSRVYARLGCEPSKAKNFAKGLVNQQTLLLIRSILNLSEDELRGIVQERRHHRIALRRYIYCFDGI